MKKIKNKSCKLIIFTIILAMVISIISPITKVIAETFGSGENTLSMDLVNNLGFTIDSVTVNGNNWTNSQDQYLTTDKQYHIEINISGNQTTGDKVPRIQYGGNWNNSIQYSSHPNGNQYSFVLDVNNTENQSFLGLEIIEDDGFQQGGGEPHFDGRAVVVWSCGNGTCYHYFSDIPAFDDGNSTFYKDTEVKADNDNTKSFDVKAARKDWILKDDFDRWVDAYKTKNNVSEIDWATVNPEDIIGDPPDMREWEDRAIEDKACTRDNTPQDEFQSCVDDYYAAHGGGNGLPFVKLQPVGEPSENNAYVSYGDRNFKVVIYSEDYEGITMDNLSELHYYPSSWTNPFVRRDQFDLSESTKDKPALIDSILLESTVVLKTLNCNSYTINAIEALDVPEDAVNISKENDGSWKLVFKSNFYDNVKFKVTDSNGHVSYMQIKRYTIDGWIGHINNRPTLIADFFFDREKSYSDFDLSAKILYKDGTTKNVKLTAQDGIDDGLGNITPGYEVDEEAAGGKGLKKATFVYALEDGEDSKIQDVYLNAEFKGSTATNYAGAYVGSGEGVLANIYHGEGN